MWSFNVQLIVAIFLFILLIDWVITRKVITYALNKLFFLPMLYSFFAAWQLLQVFERKSVLLGVIMLVFGLAFLLTGLNRLLRRPYRRS